MYRPQRRTLVVVLVSFFVMLAVVSLLLVSKSKKQPDLDSGKYFDKNSGETVSNPKGKAPDTYGTASGQPIYLGVSELVNSGLSVDQLNRLKYAFSNYSSQSKKNIKEISVNVNSITHGPRKKFSNDPFSILFKVTFDRKNTYSAKIEYKGLEDVHLYLYDQKNNATIYDSGPIGVDAGE